MKRFALLLRAVLPPILYDGLRRLRRRVLGRRPEWEYVPEGWARAPTLRGWNVQAMADRHRLLWPRWTHTLLGTGLVGVDFWLSLRTGYYEAELVPTDLPFAHNAILVFGYALALTARGRDRLSILDWGGGVGQFLPITKALLPDVKVDYHVKDVPVLCELGRELNPQAHFYADDSWRERRYDLVFSTAAFQLHEEWEDSLAALARVTDGHLLLTRTPVVFRNPSFVVLQRAEAYGVETEFLGWFLNRDEIVTCARDAGMELTREFLMVDGCPAEGVPEQATFRGFLFRPAIGLTPNGP